MAIINYVEVALGKLLYSARDHDAGLFTRLPVFEDIPENLTITSPDNGPSHSFLQNDCTQIGADRFPELTWTKEPADLAVAEYLLIVQDVDAPLPAAIVHGLFWGIPGTATRITAGDIELADKANGISKGTKSGWRIGKNLLGTRYRGARPLLGHGEHRYFYQLVALREPIDPQGLDEKAATKEQLAEKMRENIVGWGSWVGRCERKWGEKH